MLKSTSYFTWYNVFNNEYHLTSAIVVLQIEYMFVIAQVACNFLGKVSKS